VVLRTGKDNGRSQSRPATARRSAAADAAKRTTAPAPRRLSGRAMAIGLVLLALMLAYAYPVRLYLNQRAQIQQLELSQAQQRATIGQLATESAKWNDPAYVKAQARARFQMVEPGTKAYLVLPAPQTAPPAGAVADPTTTPGTWYGVLWSALRTADHPDGP
jgi:cell division protein FtsB